MPIGRILEQLNNAELLHWQAYLQYLQSEPRGDRRGDWQAAQIVKAIYDVALGFNGKTNPATLEQHLLQFATVDEKQLARQNLRAARAIFGKVVPL